MRQMRGTAVRNSADAAAATQAPTVGGAAATQAQRPDSARDAAPHSDLAGIGGARIRRELRASGSRASEDVWGDYRDRPCVHLGIQRY